VYGKQPTLTVSFFESMEEYAGDEQGKEGDSLLQAVFLEEIFVDKYFDVRMVSMYNLIYSN
jgi:hypothetical protein